MARAPSQFQEFVETALPQVAQGKGGRRKGKLNKQSDGSFSDSSNSFIRQKTSLTHNFPGSSPQPQLPHTILPARPTTSASSIHSRHHLNDPPTSPSSGGLLLGPASESSGPGSCALSAVGRLAAAAVLVLLMAVAYLLMLTAAAGVVVGVAV